jgi:hypothetical protein
MLFYANAISNPDMPPLGQPFVSPFVEELSVWVYKKLVDLWSWIGCQGTEASSLPSRVIQRSVSQGLDALTGRITPTFQKTVGLSMQERILQK